MQGLTQELVERVFQHLSNQDLCNVARTNRRHTNIAGRYIYSECTLDSEDPIQVEKNMIGLLRTLAGHPQWHRSVKYLGAPGWDDGFSQLPLGERLSQADITSIIDACPILHHSPLAQELRLRLRTSSQDAMTAILLSIMPNLRTLVLNMRNLHTVEGEEQEEVQSLHFGQMLTFRLVELANGFSFHNGSHILDNLTDAHLTAEVSAGLPTWDFKLVSLFIRLPTLRHFSGRGCSSLAGMGGWACDARQSRVKSLDLNQCDLDTDAITTVLRSCTSLNDFMCSRRCNTCSQGRATVDYAQVREALGDHRHVLNMLTLDCVSCEHYQDVPKEGDSRIGSLAEFDALEHLNIDENALYAEQDYATLSLADIIPRNLAQLRFHSSDSFSSSLFIDQAAGVLTLPNSLERIEVMFHGLEDDELVAIISEHHSQADMLPTSDDGDPILTLWRIPDSSRSNSVTME